MFPRLQFEFVLEPWLSLVAVRKPSLVIPDQVGRNSCWAATTSAVRSDYRLPMPPPNSEKDFAEAFWQEAGVLLGASKAWDDEVKDLEPVLQFGQIWIGGPLKASPNMEKDIQSWLDQQAYLIVGERKKSGRHAVVVSDWNGDVGAPIYYRHDPEDEGRSVDRRFKEVFPTDRLFYRTTRTWGAP